MSVYSLRTAPANSIARLALACAASLAMLAATTCYGAEAMLNDGDRIVFFGDSITQGGVKPTGYVTVFKQLRAEKHPDQKVEVIGAGISGNKVPDLERRLERDVLSKKPSVVVIYIGINDVWHSERGNGTPKDEYEAGLRRLIGKINDAGARVVLCTPSVIGEKTDGSNKLDAMLDEYADISRKVAADTKTPLHDLRQAFLDHLKQHNKTNAAKDVLTTDGVHLNDAGNRFVADQMLAALNGGAHKAASSEKGLLRHVVLFKFKDSVSKEEVQEVVDAFRALPKKIDAIDDFEWGTDVGVENLSAGFTHCFFVTFRDEKGRDTYLPHPGHEEFKKLVGPRLEKVLVVDYWVKK